MTTEIKELICYRIGITNRRNRGMLVRKLSRITGHNQASILNKCLSIPGGTPSVYNRFHFGITLPRGTRMDWWTESGKVRSQVPQVSVSFHSWGRPVSVHHMDALECADSISLGADVVCYHPNIARLFPSDSDMHGDLPDFVYQSTDFCFNFCSQIYLVKRLMVVHSWY